MSNLASSKYPVVTATASKYQWYWQEQPLSIAYETVGIGEPILLLPSFSTVPLDFQTATMNSPSCAITCLSPRPSC